MATLSQSQLRIQTRAKSTNAHATHYYRNYTQRTTGRRSRYRLTNHSQERYEPRPDIARSNKDGTATIRTPSLFHGTTDAGGARRPILRTIGLTGVGRDGHDIVIGTTRISVAAYAFSANVAYACLSWVWPVHAPGAIGTTRAGIDPAVRLVTRPPTVAFALFVPLIRPLRGPPHTQP